MSAIRNDLALVSARRWLMLVSGLCCFGIGVALMVTAGLGLSPWESLHQGISIHTGLPIGTVSIFLGVPILLLWFPLGERPGIGTVLNVVFIGLVTNLSLPLLPRYTLLGLQLLQMVLGMIMIGVGSGLYLSSKLGAGPRDGLMMGTTRRTGLSIRVTRTAIELTVLVVAWLLGGTIGIGTVAFALAIGPIVQLTFRVLGVMPAKAAIPKLVAQEAGAQPQAAPEN